MPEALRAELAARVATALSRDVPGAGGHCRQRCRGRGDEPVDGLEGLNRRGYRKPVTTPGFCGVPTDVEIAGFSCITISSTDALVPPVTAET